MPWELASSPGHAQQRRWQKRCKKSSFAFYQAVRDRLPVWMLEEMRTMEVFHWEESGRASSYSPAEALLYALVHDHQPYGQYLLSREPRAALAVPSPSFCCCQAPGPQLAMAVRYNRAATLARMLEVLRRRFAPGERRRYLDRRGCRAVEGGKTPLHLAAELGRPECLSLLLAHGSSPRLADCEGNTALDTLLGRLLCERGRADTESRGRRCLHSLLLFSPHASPKTRQELRDKAALWQPLLGTDLYQWLSGRSPPPLFTSAMQTLIRAIGPEHFPEGLDQLPISHLLGTVDFKPTAESSGYK